MCHLVTQAQPRSRLKCHIFFEWPLISSEDSVGAILQVQEEARRELECVICLEVPRPGANFTSILQADFFAQKCFMKL